MKRPLRQAARALAAMGLILALAWILHRPVLTSLGGWLTLEEPLRQADAAIAMTGAHPAAEIELADLFKDRVVPRVAFVLPESSRASLELARRGVRDTTTADVLIGLGVPANAIEPIPAADGGTTDASQAVAHWCRSRGIGRVVVVTSGDHARRVKRALQRALSGTSVAVLIRIPRFGRFRPSDWWQERSSLRSGLVELQKLLLDYAAHPLG